VQFLMKNRVVFKKDVMMTPEKFFLPGQDVEREMDLVKPDLP